MEIKVRNVETALVARIRLAAKAAGVSMESHLRELLEREYGSACDGSVGVRFDVEQEAARLDREVEALKARMASIDSMVAVAFPGRRKSFGGRVDEVDYAE